MAKVLTSWKEIALYVGKGVRTVQRWEHELGFPVRRPLLAGTQVSGKQVVLAFPHEIDEWVQSQTHTTEHSQLEIDTLRDQLKCLQSEVMRLRRQIHGASLPGEQPANTHPETNAAIFGVEDAKSGSRRETRCRVLVVDDNEAQCYTIGRMLHQAKIEVIEAATGVKALAAALNHEPDIVLLDINLPDMNGLVVAEILKAAVRTRHLPVIFYSADTSRYQDWKANGRGTFLTTPIEPSELLGTIRGTLARGADGNLDGPAFAA